MRRLISFLMIVDCVAYKERMEVRLRKHNNKLTFDT